MAVLAMSYAMAQTVLFTETFDKCEGTGGNDGKWSGNNIAAGTFSTDNGGWSASYASGAKQCARFGTSKKQGSATTPEIALTGSGTLTFRAGAWAGDSETLNISASGATLSQNSVTLVDSKFTDYTIDITNATSTVKITFSGANASKSRFFLDDVKVTAVGGKTAAGLSFSVSTAAAYIGSAFDEPTLSNPNSLAVAYASSDPSVATVDASTGEVTLVAAGTTTITASSAETDTYAAGKASYTLTVNKQESGLSFSPTEETITVDGPFTAPTFSNAKGIAVKFSSSNTSVATVDDNGNITFKGVAGTATITATPADPNYSGDATFSLTVSKLTSNLKWESNAVTATKGKAFKAPKLSNPDRLAVTYTSSKTAVATVNSRGILTVVGTGTTTITAASAESDRYSAASDSYTLTVVGKSGNFISDGNNKFKLITSADQLIAGRKYVFMSRVPIIKKGVVIDTVGDDVAMTASARTNFAITTTDDHRYGTTAGFSYVDTTTREEINVTSEDLKLTLQGNADDGWQWYVSEAYNKAGELITGYLQTGDNGNLRDSHQMHVYDTTDKAYQTSQTLTTVTFPEKGVAYTNNSNTYYAENGVEIVFNISKTDSKGRDNIVMYNANGSNRYVAAYGRTQCPIYLYGEEGTISTGDETCNLADLAFNSEGTFTITGQDMQAVTTVHDKSKYYVVVKDGNGLSNDYVSKNDGLDTYYHNGKEWSDYDQSNWALVEVSESDYKAFNPAAVTKIVGKYNGNANDPIITDATITYGDATADDSKYTPNEYIPVNFMTVKQADYWGNSQKANHGNYFFMNPKAQEYAKVAWAVWDASSQAFYVAKSADGANKYDFDGMFTIALDYNDGKVTATSDLTDQQVYSFPAIVKKQTAVSNAAPRKVTAKTGSTQSEYIVYPLELYAGKGVVTGVSEVSTAKAVKSVRYYDLTGAQHSQAQEGINIVVTTYSDGTTTARKIMK